MKNTILKKLLSIVLSALMIVALLVPGTVFGVLAEPVSYPAPTMTESPTLLKHFAKPSAVIPTDFSDAYNPTFSGEVESGAPAIATITEQAGPNDSVSIYGDFTAGSKVYAYGLKGGEGVTKELKQTLNKDGFINAIIPSNFDYGMYIIWVQGADGKMSAPVRVNAPKLTWIGDTVAKAGATGIRIYGKFLTTDNADGKDAKSYVYLTNGTSYYEATVTEASPYRVTVTLPTGLANGTYKVLVHNGHGGSYGWSDALSLKIDSSAGYTFSSSNTVTVNPGDNLKSKISNAADGSTIYIKNGVYPVTQQISISKKLRIVGESKDGVIIVGVFTQSGGSGSLAYGDLHVNASRKAAFYVKSTRCEISNITFADYVKGAEYCENITEPSGYSIDYAHGMFFEVVDPSTDTGMTGQFKVDNCNFKIRRIHSDTNCIYFGDSQRAKIHAEIEAIYGTQYYSKTAYGSAPMWIDADRAEISNCYFETAKEIVFRQANNSYIHDNTFVGTWVISGNSGPSAIHDNYTQNLDISNNRIMGKDEITDPDGYVKTYDQTFARTLVFQKTYNVTKNVYLLNNHASRVGELNYNSGEHILFEDENVTYVGKATLSNNNKTLYLKDMPTEKWSSDNKFKGYITGDDGVIKLASYSRSIAGQVVIISKGAGAGQWRTITSASNLSVTIDRDWDVQPDANSTFVVVSPFINTVVYKNTIEGPEKYYENFNSTLGINAYGSMVGTVVDRNNFSQMQAGMAINPHYNPKQYTYNGATVSLDFGFVMLADLLVMNNTISNTRYGIWNFPTINLDKMDNSTDEAAVDLQLCSVFRKNNISNSRRLTGGSSINNKVDTALKKRGGASIVVGRDYWDKYQVLSTRYWMNNIVVENNVLSDVENNSGKGFIDVSFSQNDTIVRNNTFDGALKDTYAEVEVERNGTHSTYKKPQPPVWYVAVDEPDDDDGEQGGTTPPADDDEEQIPAYYGTEADGFDSKGSSWPMALKPVDSIRNLDFEQGFIYWSGKKYENANNPGSLASDSFKLVTEGGNKYITLRDDGYVNTARTALFKVAGVNIGDKLVVIYTAKGADAKKIRVTLIQDHLRGDGKVSYDETTGLNTTSTNPSPGISNPLVNGSASLSVYDKLKAPTGWTTYVTGSTNAINDPTKVSTNVCTSDIYLQVILEKASGVSVGDKLDAAIDNIIIAKDVDGVYYDVVTGEEVKGEITLPEGDDNGEQGGTTPPEGGEGDDSGEQGGTTPPEGGEGDDSGEQGGTTPPAITHPSYYGTEADGFSSVLSSYPKRLKPADGIFNLDFEQGFIYWSGQKYSNASTDKNVLASNCFKIVDDGVNKYLTLKDGGYVNTAQTAMFKVSDLKVGDKVVLIYDAKGQNATALRPYLKQDGLRPVEYDENGMSTTLKEGTNDIWNPSSGNAGGDILSVDAAQTEFVIQTGSAGWTTYVTATATIVDPTSIASNASADIFLQVLIGKSSGAATTFDSAIDNIRIAKVANGVYTDLATGEVIYDPSVVEPPVSSVEIANPPKTEYLQGQKLDITGGRITIKYTDGTQKTVSIAQNMLSGYNPKLLGQQTVTVTYKGVTTTFTVNVSIDPNGELTADTLVWLIGIILADQTDNMTADFNQDKNVDILDVVYLKKQLAKIELSKTPITAPMHTASSTDVYSNKIVRYELNSENRGYYFTPKAEGTYPTIIVIHGQGSVSTFRDRLLSTFNKWVKEGYIEPMVVVIPEVLTSYGTVDANSSDSDDFQYFILSSRTTRFSALLSSIEKGTLSAKIDTSIKPCVAGFSMGGMAAVYAGAEYPTRIKSVGGLSPSAGFYLGEGKWGYRNYAADIYYSTEKDALVYLSAGLGEGSGFRETIARYEEAINVNNEGIVTRYEAPSSWGGHNWNLAQKELFMYLCKNEYDRLPSVTLVESVCNPNAYTTPTIVYSAADEHK